MRQPDLVPDDQLDAALDEILGPWKIPLSALLVRLLGSSAALLIQQLLYWHARHVAKSQVKAPNRRGRVGWIYNTSFEMQRQTGLRKGALETAKKKLIRLGVLKCEVAGIPPVTWWHVNKRRLLEHLFAISTAPACGEFNLPESGKTECRNRGNTLILTSDTNEKVRGVLQTPLVALKEKKIALKAQSPKWQTLAERYSDAELAEMCWEIASEPDTQHLFPKEFVSSFVTHHEGENRWTVNGDPIFDLPAALKAWCAKAIQVGEARAAETSQETNTNESLTDFGLKCCEVAYDHDLETDFVEIFIEQHEKSGGTAINPATGELEPIRDLEATLIAFCEKLEADRTGD